MEFDGAPVGIGLTLGPIGLESQSRASRFDFGIPRLLHGIDTVIIIVALFALGEVIYLAAKMRQGKPAVIPVSLCVKLDLSQCRRERQAQR
ncbi:tripartite tricarboxylate transporter permease [Cryobacterium sp. Y82]|uniref:tripartite tricarboxylate transporter permease n=1 Tax=Cryobacterium sp. Y82 TaxID=2045017 RepID=UPI000CE54479|nr:tripartite tricarboxylate transporter permease [Cryobacterium sp. Y82]